MSFVIRGKPCRAIAVPPIRKYSTRWSRNALASWTRSSSVGSRREGPEATFMRVPVRAPELERSPSCDRTRSSRSSCESAGPGLWVPPAQQEAGPKPGAAAAPSSRPASRRAAPASFPAHASPRRAGDPPGAHFIVAAVAKPLAGPSPLGASACSETPSDSHSDRTVDSRQSFPASMLMRARRVMPTRCATCCWLKPSAFRARNRGPITESCSGNDGIFTRVKRTTLRC